MRKTIGWVSLVLQVITLIATITVLAIQNFNWSSGEIRTLIPFYLWAAWAGMSLGIKPAMIKNMDFSLGFVPTVMGIISLVVYLVVINPGPSFSETTIGLIITIALFVFFMIDLIDAAYQKTCKI